MSFTQNLLMRMFGRPTGVLGRLGGLLMARMNRPCAQWLVQVLDVRPNDHIVEIGFGPGVALAILADSAPDGYIAGADASLEMLQQASARNAKAIKDGRVSLYCAAADRLPFADNAFDKALAINSMQVWPDAAAGVREILRVVKPGGTIALGFTPYSGLTREALPELLAKAGLTETRIVAAEAGFCALVTKS